MIDDPRAEGLVAGCCLLASVDLQVVRIAVRTAEAPERVPEADGFSTNEHLRTVAPKVALLQVVIVRKVNVAIDVAKTCPAHCL